MSDIEAQLSLAQTLPLLLCASAFDELKTTVLILPFLAMQCEYRRRAQQYHITHETWTIDSDVSSPPQILLVAVEAGGWERLQVYIDILYRLCRLARIFVSEAHRLLYDTESRPCIAMLKYFGQTPTPMVLATATLPRSLENQLFRTIGRRLYRVIRRPMEHPEIAHKMIKLNQLDLEDVATQIRDFISGPDGQEPSLLLCQTGETCDVMADKLNWKPYHSDIYIANRAHFMEEWLSGKFPGLVCTPTHSCCIDYSAIRSVFHLGIPQDAINYMQAICRGLCNGHRNSIVYFEPARRRAVTGDDSFGQSVIQDTLLDRTTCRRLRLAIFFDGVAIPCVMLPGGQLCDVCEKESCQSPPQNGPALFPNHLFPSSLPESENHSASDDNTSVSMSGTALTNSASISGAGSIANLMDHRFATRPGTLGDPKDNDLQSITINAASSGKLSSAVFLKK
jgi:Helicase conserved C-terminal domain